MRSAALVLACLAACAGERPTPRFANAAPVLAVDDRRDVPRPPEADELVIALYHFDGTLHRRLTRALELPRPRRALGVNALDEVPDSTWFTNRIGVRELTLDELRAGPTRGGSPESHKPWTVNKTKSIGEAPGFLATDARGVKFLIKFDRTGFPEIETAAHVIVNRILWAVGYNVPEDFIAHVRPEELLVARDAVVSDAVGDKRPFLKADLDRLLAGVEREADGSIRVMASRMLDGKPLGGHVPEGTRRGDPNDRIPHELRRDLRGARPLFAWLDHVDIAEDNMLDVWVADRADPKRHYVEHYWLDFGKSLGAMAAIERDPRRGAEYRIDFAEMFGSLVTLGLRPRPWEAREPSALRGVGMFGPDFDPEAWKPHAPTYLPIRATDHVDWFWGAKIMMRFSPPQLRAIVESVRLTDPRAVEYLTSTLIARQRAVARFAFARINPLDRFELGERGLCFEDLVLAYALGARPEDTRYVATTRDLAGKQLAAPQTIAAARGGRACTGLLAMAPGDGYTIARVQTTRPGFARGTDVHLARAPSGAWRIIGLWRD